MPVYVGRTDQAPETFLLGGINAKSSIVNIKDGEAKNIENWDVDIGGFLLPRAGYSLSYDFSPTGTFVDSYTRQDGTTVYVAVSEGRFYEALSPSGPFSDMSDFGQVFLNEKTGPDGIPLIGVAFGSSYVIAGAGQSAPAYSSYGNALVTLEAASQLQAPNDMAITQGGTAGSTPYYYLITTMTGRGESLPSSTVTTSTGNATLSVTNYNILTWTPILGENAGYNIYRYDPSSSTYKLLGSAVSGASTFSDAGQPLSDQTPPVSNTAFNTPNDWNLNGYPEGFAPIAMGKDQRLLAWRRDTVWVSAANNHLDWLSPGDSGAFTYQLYGGIDNRVRAVAVLFDLVAIFTRTNCFFYTGSTSSDYTLNKIQGTGCTSPKSIVQIGDDLMLWSQYGPTSLKRILSGADVESQSVSIKVAPIVYQETTRDHWWRIVAYNDIPNQKVVWIYPDDSEATGDDKYNTGALVFRYTINSWTKYTNYAFSDATVAPDGAILLMGPDGKLMVVGGTTDNGANIQCRYESAYYDLRTFLKKRMVWLDFIMDSTGGDYTATVDVDWNWGQSGMSTSHELKSETVGGVTTASTDGREIETTGSKANFHRIYTSGDGRAYQFIITCDDTPNPPRVLGYRGDLRVKGVR